MRSCSNKDIDDLPGDLCEECLSVYNNFFLLVERAGRARNLRPEPPAIAILTMTLFEGYFMRVVFIG